MPRQPDIGIEIDVRLQKCGIENFELYEGGSEHAYPEPTTGYHGTPEAGGVPWRCA